MRLKIFKLLLTLFITTTLFSLGNVHVLADNPFITRTVNRFGELVETQDAYESVFKIKNIQTSSSSYLLKEPEDIYIDKDGFIYIADTGNKSIVILDKDNNYLTHFGSDNLVKPTGLFVRDNKIYIADYGEASDNTTGKVSIYQFDKLTNEVTLIENRYRPSSKILEIDNFVYRPTKISVDSNLTMYVTSEGSYNGILTINSVNRFMSYFAPNDVETSLKDKIINFLYGDNDKVLLKDILPTPPTNVHIDDSGYIYTVTQMVTKNDIGDTLKKVNISGQNFYPTQMLASSEFVSCWHGNCGNIFAATKTGFIYEYDIEGNILFIFGGNTTTIDQWGLFKSISSIAVNQNELLYILDKNDNAIQIFKPTAYTQTVHEALALYNDGKYQESKALWENVLVYNSMIDIAHKGIGLAHFMNAEYEDALTEFKLANAKQEYSEAYWEIRNIWFTTHIGLIFGLIIFLIILFFTLGILDKKFSYKARIKEKWQSLKKISWIHDFQLMFGMLKHPSDTTYFIKINKKMGYYNGIIILGLLFGIYILGLTSTGFIFNNVVIERTILLKEAFKVLIPIGLFIVANYLSSSLLEGEGTFKAIFLTSLASLMPLVIIYPLVILVSNYLTLNESFIYYFGVTIMIAWTAIILLVTNKELHNYTFKKMVLNVIMTILLMLVLLIVVILCYLMIAQVADFVKDIISEVIFHD